MTRKGPSRDSAKERSWRKAVRNQERSGQSIRAYCLGNGLTEASFYAWRRELKRRGSQRATKRQQRSTGRASFLPVQIAPATVSLSLTPIECLLPSGVVLRLPCDMEAAAIAALLKSYEQLPC